MPSAKSSARCARQWQGLTCGPKTVEFPAVSIPAAREKFKAFLAKKGLRVTNQRLAIFDAAFNHPDHFTAEEPALIQ